MADKNPQHMKTISQVFGSELLDQKLFLQDYIIFLGTYDEDGVYYILDPLPKQNAVLIKVAKAFAIVTPSGDTLLCPDGQERNLSMIAVKVDSPVLLIHPTRLTHEVMANEFETLGKNCTYAGQTYSDGSEVCQNHKTYRCDDGSWTSLGGTC